MEGVLASDPIFVALTRPQMFAGVTYTFFILNGIVSTEAFLIFKSPWVFVLAIGLHLAGMVSCLREPRVFDLWLVRARYCARVRNYRFWRCNSYCA